MPRLACLALALAFAALLLGCGGGDVDTPLTDLDIRARLFEHLIEADPDNGQRYLIRFQRGNVAEIIGAQSEFARWYTDGERGLCLQRHQEAPRCAPFYQLNPSHFRWGDTTFTDLTVRTPGIGFPGGGGSFRNEPFR